MSIYRKTISELKSHRFYVPSYQRGYRWTDFDVRTLLDDISDFSNEGNRAYCLQPLIVKKMQDGSYEVVDGQQRLTTIYIFMKIAQQEIRSAVPPFELRYQTREESARFLQELSDHTWNERSNIDFYYMGQAYKAMDQWLDEQPDRSVAVQELNTKLRKSVFFIWYEIPEDSDPIAIFTKVNLGKIPLTNAELIKALLLNKDNFSGNDLLRKQLRIAASWDRIEQGLHNEQFWYFLNNSEENSTRIDMIFDLLAKEYNSSILENHISEKQGYFSFLVFSAAMEIADDRNKFIDVLWDDVEQIYAEFSSWYEDLDKYHIIGYLISAGLSAAKIRALTAGKRKSEAKAILLDQTKNLKSGIVKGDKGKIDWRMLTLGDSTGRKNIRQVLLLFNIATLVRKGEKQYRFPFDTFKKEKWDIEHIHATADDTDEPDDSLGNLTLLDSNTNRSYKNAPFQEKRAVIIDRESKGQFVPLCTKNVFLKVYSVSLGDMELWNMADKRDYIAKLTEILDQFWDKGGAQ